MDSDRITNTKADRRRMRKEAFQLRLEAQASASAAAKSVSNPFAEAIVSSATGEKDKEMSFGDLMKSMPMLDELGESEQTVGKKNKQKNNKKREEAPQSIESLLNSSLFDELDEEKEPSKRQRKKSKVKKRTKMTATQITEQWDKVLEHDAFKSQGAAVLPQHINACFERGILK